MRTLALGVASLGLDVAADLVAGRPLRLEIPPEAARKIAASRAILEQAAAGDRAVYGVNTGFGKLARVRIGAADRATLQTNLIRSHACGVGAPLPRPIAALALLLRIQTLALGHSGVRLELVERLVDVFHRGWIPVIPSQGSVGASGDLAPLAHMALVLLGEGAVDDGRTVRPAAEVLGEAGLAPFQLAVKEGLALINGTQISTAILAVAVHEAEVLARSADAIAATTLEALKGSISPFDRRVQAIRPHPGQAVVAANFRRLLEGSAILESHRDCSRVQDNYSLRCVPQVHGAARDWIAFVRRVVETEMNSVTDNPLVFSEGGAPLVSGGNFHGEPVALAADSLKIAVAELGTSSERRVDYLVTPDLSELPPFLARHGGLESGLMIPQVVAASLVNENKVLCHPNSVDAIPTSGGKEDHVSFATAAARFAREIAANVRRILAIELLAACQGLEFETVHRPGPGVDALYRAVRKRVAPLDGDRALAAEIEDLADWIGRGEVIRTVEAAALRLD